MRELRNTDRFIITADQLAVILSALQGMTETLEENGIGYESRVKEVINRIIDEQKVSE